MDKPVIAGLLVLLIAFIFKRGFSMMFSKKESKEQVSGDSKNDYSRMAIGDGNITGDNKGGINITGSVTNSPINRGETK